MKVSRVLVSLFFVFLLMSPSIYADTRVIELGIDLSGIESCMASSTGQQNIKEQDLKLYPNPNNGVFQVTLESEEAIAQINYNVMDLTGSVIQSGSINSGSKNTFEISIPGLGAGIYNLQLNIDGRSVNKKILIVQ